MTVADYLADLPYEPDRFQREAAAHIEKGEAVVVTAPTGAGKTLIAEVAVARALDRGKRAFYTTPIKALSNQKYQDFVEEYGEHRVGLLTGDNSINGDAEIIVMTTEVFRNMIYAGSSSIDNLETVVLDEVHYLADRFRGSVWEEIIIHAPPQVQLVCLSATVANADEFTEWVQMRRGPTALIEETHRPVPLHPLFMVTDLWNGPKQMLFDMFDETGKGRKASRSVLRLLAAKTGRRKRFVKPRKGDVVERLHRESMLPAIYFIFSRNGCETAARTVASYTKLNLTTPAERKTIRAVAKARTAHLPDGDLAVLDYGRWLADLEKGIAAHHAGLVPAYKEVVEELFAGGYVKVVFATETLALGINMPARTVVLDSLTKYDGENHVLLGPSDYTQLTGRAGRRGIDEVGYGLALYSPWTRFERMAEIAAAGASRLESSFRPTYNMAVNLIANYAQEQAEDLLRASFAEFQRAAIRQQVEDRAVDRAAESASLRAQAQCELGDVWDYVDALDSSAGEILGELSPGDVIEQASGRAPSRYLILQVRPSSESPLTVLSPAGKVRQFRTAELATASYLGKISLPNGFRPRDRKSQQKLVQRLRTFHASASAGTNDHPVAACPEAADHERIVRKIRKLERKAKAKGSGPGLVDEFRSVLAVLQARGYTEGWALESPGERLRFIYSEMDLVIAECLRHEVFAGLGGADLAAVVSGFVFEARADWGAPPPPTALGAVIDDIEEIWQSLAAEEAAEHLQPTRPPDFGFTELAYHWAQGFELEEILMETTMAPGDFVRVARQLLDVLRQLRDADPSLRQSAAEAMRRVDRGVVAAGGIG